MSNISKSDSQAYVAMLSNSGFSTLASRVAEIIQKYQKQSLCDAWSFYFYKSSGLDVSVHAQTLESLEHVQEASFGLSIYHDGRVSTTSTSGLQLASIEQSVKMAVDRVAFSEADPCNGLPPREHLATDPVDCKLFIPWELTATEAIKQTIACAKLGDEHAELRCDEASFSARASHYAVCNSSDFFAEYPLSRYSRTCSLMLPDDVSPQVDYDFTSARDPQKLDSPEVLAQRTIDKTLARRSPRQVSTQICDIIFTPSVARQFWSHLTSALSGGAIYRQSSFLCDKLQQKIMPPGYSVLQRPHILSAMASEPFDDNGVATQDLDIVVDGICKSYLLSTYAAKRLSLPLTGNAGGIQNICLTVPEKFTQQELIASMQRGLLITDVMGQGVDLTTGNYSRGFFGYWIENGEVQFPVHECTLAGNLSDMFMSICGMSSDDIDQRTRIQTGSVWLSGMSIAGS